MTKEQIQKGITEHINPTLLLFKNNITNRFIKYYISTNIEYNMTNELANDIGNCDGLVLSGYLPNKKVLDYFIKPKILIAYSGTCYDEYCNNVNIMTFLKNNKIYKKYFIKGYFMPSHVQEYQTYFEIKPKEFYNIEHLIDISNKWYELWKIS